MPSYVALLRAVNVAGRSVKMLDLMTWLEEAGCRDVSTYLQSGNAVFGSGTRSAEMLASKLEAHLHKCCGMAISVIARDKKAFARVVAANPFAARDLDIDLKKLHCTFLADAPTAAAVRALSPKMVAGEAFHCKDAEVFLQTPKYGETKLSNSYFERALGTRATTRNWKTVLALQERLNAL